MIIETLKKNLLKKDKRMEIEIYKEKPFKSNNKQRYLFHW